MKNAKKGLGLYLIIFFIGFCVILWMQKDSIETDEAYTIDNFQGDVANGLISTVEIYQNQEVPTGVVYIVYNSTGAEKEFYVSDVNVVQEIVMEFSDGSIAMALHDVTKPNRFLNWLPAIAIGILVIFLITSLMSSASAGGGAGERCHGVWLLRGGSGAIRRCGV